MQCVYIQVAPFSLPHTSVFGLGCVYGLSWGSPSANMTHVHTELNFSLQNIYISRQQMQVTCVMAACIHSFCIGGHLQATKAQYASTQTCTIKDGYA